MLGCLTGNLEACSPLLLSSVFHHLNKIKSINLSYFYYVRHLNNESVVLTTGQNMAILAVSKYTF